MLRATVSSALLIAAVFASTVRAEEEAKAPALTGLAREARTVADAVVKARGLAEKTPLEIRVHDAAEFRELVGAEFRDELPEHVDEMRAEWMAFSLAPADVDPAAAFRALMQDAVAGFYDPHTKALHVPKELPAAHRSSSFVLRNVIAHEVEHALQDQHFGLDHDEASGDEGLAARALVEGEATLVGDLVGSGLSAMAPKVLLARIREAVSAPEAQVLEATGRAKSGLEAPRVARSWVTFPYVHGLAFAAELYVAGGFPLLDRAFAHPPRTSEQVLHPARYLAGEAAVPVQAPAVGAEERKVAQDTLGEFGASALLAGCLGDAAAAKAAAGWGGDAYTISVRGERSLVLRWATVWDDEREATEFAAAMRQLTRCWKDVASPADMVPSWSMNGAFVVKQEGRRVAVVRGLSTAAMETEATPLLALPGEAPPPTPPFEAVKLVRHVEDAQVGPSKVAFGTWENASLGLTSRMPSGARGTADLGSVVFMVDRRVPKPAFALLRFAAAADSPTLRETLFRAYAEGAQHSEKKKVSTASTGPRSVAGIASTERRWTMAGSTRELGAIVVPICNHAVVLIQSTWEEKSGKSALDEWIDSLKRTAAPAGICAAVGG